MLFGKKYISKAISSGLLLALLLMHSVKLLHSHPNKNSCSKDIHGNSIVKNSPDCNVCSYQVAKDADDHTYCDYKLYTPGRNLISKSLVSFYKPSFFPAFEGRGPPQVI